MISYLVCFSCVFASIPMQLPARHSKPVLDYLPQLVSESGGANSQPNSPLLKIELEECSIVCDQDSQTLSKDNDYLLLSPTHCSCPINQLSQSPRHSHYRSNSNDQSDCFPPHSPLEMPSSPLLVAMRDAVDSLNKYEDFKILEKIGAGFFAEVYKVSSFVKSSPFIVYHCKTAIYC